MKILVILHGWGSSKERWQKVKEEIVKSGVRVIVPDIPGFKPETELQKPWDLDDYTDWFNGFLSSENISEPFFLLGHSFGGTIAAKFSLRYPKKIEKLFLVAASCIRKRTLRTKLLGMAARILKFFSFLPLYSLFRRAFYKFIVRKSDYLGVEGVMKETYLKIIKEDLSESLSSIKTLTVLIWGKKDDVKPIEEAYLIKKKINKSRLVIIPEAGHDLEQKVPDILAKKILENL